MSAPQPQGSSYFAAFLATVTWAAMAFAAMGLLSWALDREPVSQPVGPGFAFMALLGSGLFVWLLSARSARGSWPWLGMAAAAVGAYLIVCGAAFVFSTALALEQATSVFVIVSCVLAPGAVALAWVLVRLGPRSRG